MDRTFVTAAVLFAALAAAGVGLTVFSSQIAADASTIRALGPALLGGGLAAFLVQALDRDRARTRR